MWIIQDHPLGLDYTFQDMNYYPAFLVKSIQTDRQTESGAYEPTTQNAQVGSKTWVSLAIEEYFM